MLFSVELLFTRFMVALQSLSHVRLFVIPWTVAHQASLSFTISWSVLKLLSFELVMPSNHLILCHPLSSSLPSFSASGSFPMSPHVASCGQSIGASASVFPMKIQSWFHLTLTGLTPWCPRDSQESSTVPHFKGNSSSVLSLFYCPILTSIHDYWKNHSFDYKDLCWQSNVSAFNFFQKLNK